MVNVDLLIEQLFDEVMTGRNTVSDKISEGNNFSAKEVAPKDFLDRLESKQLSYEPTYAMPDSMKASTSSPEENNQSRVVSTFASRVPQRGIFSAIASPSAYRNYKKVKQDQLDKFLRGEVGGQRTIGNMTETILA